MLEKETVLDLLDVVESGTVDVPALPLLQSIVQFGIPAQVRSELGARIAELLDVPPGTPDRPEYLSALAALTTVEAATRLRAVATDILDPDSFTAARLLTGEGASEAVASHLPHLARIAEESDDTAALRALATLPLERYAVPASTFAGSLASPDIENRLWAAIAVAKLGDTAPLVRVLRDLADDCPDWMGGNPWTPYDELSATRPLPEAVRAVLLDLDDEGLERNQRILIWALTGARTATGQEIPDAEGPATRDQPFQPVAPMTPGEADRLLHTVEAATHNHDLSLLTYVDLHRAPLLPDGPRSHVVARLVETCIVQQDTWGAIHWGNAAMDAIGATPRLDLPVGRIVDSYVHHDAPGMSVQQLGAVLSRADDDGVARVIAQGIRSEPSAADRLATLLEEASRGTVVYLGAGGGAGTGGGFTYPGPSDQQPPGQAGPPPPAPSAPPPPAPSAPPPPAPSAPPPPAPSAPSPPAPSAPSRRPGLHWPKFRLPGRRPKPTSPPSEPRPAPESPFHSGQPMHSDPRIGEDPAGEAPVPYQAWPQIKVDSDIVVFDEEFDVTIGLAARESDVPGVAFAGSITFAERFPIEDLEVELVVDPRSLEVVGGTRVFPLPVTSPGDFPTRVVTLRALSAQDLQRERQIALLFRRAGRIVGFGFRRIVAVSSAERAHADGPANLDPELLDLSPLVGDEAPDLLLCLFEGDSPDSYVWGVYPRSGATPDLARSGGMMKGTTEFATFTRRALNAKEIRGLEAYRTLRGLGSYVDGALPRVVTDVIRGLVEASPDQAPSVLLLTQEPFVPWELAVLDPPLVSSYGKGSPFLGAHTAFTRWPIGKKRQQRLPRLSVTKQAAITAHYAGDKRWKPLEHAEAEVAGLVRDYGMTPVNGSPDEVVSCFEGTTSYDVIHVALHGQFDHAGAEDGLVLVEIDAEGRPVARYLTTTQVRGLEPGGGTPFVFLNACQVGSGDSVLGTYGGFAAALALSRASAVVAPLWNVDDRVAAEVSRRFYAAAYASPPTPVAEIIRSIRADYTREGVTADPDLCHPTLVAYQCFGHPRFILQRDATED